MTQQPPRSPFSNVNKAALVAASNTSSTPSPVKEEHSRYFRAPISRAAVLPSLSVVKCIDFFLISSWASGSSRRSFLSPTRRMGTPGQRSFASSTHCQGISRVGGLVASYACFDLTLCLTLSSESGVSTEKPINITCAFEYARGRNRS